MSRIAKAEVKIPSGVEIKQTGQELAIKGPKSPKAISLTVPANIPVVIENNVLTIQLPKGSDKNVRMHGGTARANIANAVKGVTEGFEKKLLLVGVGYKAAAQGNKLTLNLGYSHPIVFDVPEGITIETPTQTDIVIKGVDKQLVGHVASEIRAYRPPEPYKGKGVKYSDEVIVRKEAKKK